MYALYRPDENRERSRQAVAALLDLLFEERGYQPISSSQSDCEEIRRAWYSKLLPSVEAEDVSQLLEQRRYVILQGPPGTGKTLMATELLRSRYGGQGHSIQFHANTTYETFIGGLGPVVETNEFGLKFSPQCGELMEAVRAAQTTDRPYLLHIDEINRADLSKV